MRNKLLISFISLFFTLNLVAQQNTFVLKLNSTSKKPPKLDELKVKLVVKDLGANSFSITTEIVTNPGNYRLFLVDENLTKNINASTWGSMTAMYKWLKGVNFGRAFELENLKNKIDFNGKFIDYNRGRQKRTEWNKGYVGFNTFAVDEYHVTGSRAGANDDLYVSYVFVLTERRTDGSTVFIGISEAVKIIVPESIANNPNAIVKKSSNSNNPEGIEKLWETRIKDELLVTFLTEECFNYQQVYNNPVLISLYKLEKFNEKIEQAIANVSSALAAPEHAAKRHELLTLLIAFRETDIQVSEKTEKRSQASVKSESTDKKVPDTKKGEKYGKLKSKYANINTTLRRTKENIDFLQNRLVKNKIIELREQLNSCNGKKACISNIQEEYEILRQGWDTHINDHTRVLNIAIYDLSSLEADKNFAKSGISTNGIEPRIEELKTRNTKLKKDIEAFGREIESNLINKSVYANISSLYSDDAESLSTDYKSIKLIYTKAEQKYWNTAELAKSDIKALNDASRVADRVKTSLEDILKQARQRYDDETGLSSFPVATFINEFELPTNADCETLKNNIERLINDARISEKGGGILSNIMIIVVVLIVFVGGYFYFKSIISGKVKKQKLATAREFAPGNGTEGIAEGMEILEDEEEKNKGKGLELVYKLNKIKYHEIDVQSLLEDTSVRKIFMSDEFIIDAYRYFEDKMLEVGRDNIDSLYEYGGFIIGKWDVSPYSEQQYDVSLEHFIQPGDDAKFTKFNIDFGYEISFRMESKLIDLAKQDNDQVLVGWLHSHPGHDIFLSNYDLEVQETFRNQYHPNRHIALVLEPTTQEWDLGLFSFNKAGVMNNKEEMKSVMSFHKLYDWALGKYVAERTSKHFRFEVFGAEKSGRVATSFDKSALTQIKIIAEREFAVNKNTVDIYDFWGVEVDAGKSGTLVHAIDLKPSNENVTIASLDKIGGYGVFSGKSPLQSVPREYLEQLSGTKVSFLIIYLTEEDKFLFISINEGNKPQPYSDWIEFSLKDMLPFLNDSSITVS